MPKSEFHQADAGAWNPNQKFNFMNLLGQAQALMNFAASQSNMMGQFMLIENMWAMLRPLVEASKDKDKWKTRRKKLAVKYDYGDTIPEQRTFSMLALIWEVIDEEVKPLVDRVPLGVSSSSKEVFGDGERK